MRQEIDKRGWSYREFAQQIETRFRIDCSHSAIGKILKKKPDGEPATKTSHLVPPICELLGIPRGVVANPELTQDSDPRESTMLSAFRKLPSDEQDAFIAYLTTRVKPR